MIVVYLTKHCSTIMASCWQVPGGPVGNFDGSMGHPACPLPRTGHGACGKPMEIQQKNLPCENHGNIAFYRILSPMVIDFGDDL